LVTSSGNFLNFPGGTDVAPAETIAAIFVWNGGSNSVLFVGGGGNQAVAVYIDGASSLLGAYASATITSGIVIQVGVPYFVACSFKDGGPSYFLAKRLDTGAVSTSVIGNVGPINASPGGLYYVGSDFYGQTFLGKLAAVAYAPSFVTMGDLRRWADDPWAFWYPRFEPEMLVSASLANLFSQTVSVACASASAIGKGAAKQLAILCAGVVSSARQAFKAVAVSCASTVSRLKQISKAVAAACATLTVVVGIRAVLVTIAAARVSSVSIVKSISKRIGIGGPTTVVIGAITGAVVYAVNLTVTCASAVLGSASSIVAAIWAAAVKSRENWSRE
jgi:hypothetical protein